MGRGNNAMTDVQIDDVLEKYKGTFPVPVMDVARELGVKVFLSKFPDNKSGEIVKDDDETYNIYLNANHPYARTRFTLAHELAHLRLHRPFLDSEKEIEDFVGRTFKLSLSRDKHQVKDKREIDADQFAAELLMPEEKFVGVWNKKKTIHEVAEIFGVSPSAAETRARILSERLRADACSEENQEA